jgi:GntR family transcriptional regulator/MocR family aminotransferase
LMSAMEELAFDSSVERLVRREFRGLTGMLQEPLPGDLPGPLFAVAQRQEGMEFTLNLDVDAGEGSSGLASRLYQELRKAVLEGRLSAGAKLPSSRDLAASLVVSRNTVSDVYDRLALEGYFEARRGSGTFVQRGLEAEHPSRPTPVEFAAISQWAKRLSASRSVVPGRELVYDFRPGVPDFRIFPIEVWRRLTARNLRVLSNEVGPYGDAAGQPRLRAAIARYLSHSRAVRCDGSDVFICNGSQQALDLLGRILIDPGTRVAIEDPGYTPAVAVFRAMRADIVDVPVDQDGLVVDKIPDRVKMIYVTPSHQFPLGVTLSLARRKALLAWADRHGAVIIEDDYDSEFRFGGRPMESLQGLDRSGRVVYLGTFSKVLFPGLRLGYVVAPQWLQEPFVTAKWITDRHTSALEQAVMADFIAEGHFGRHLRRMQRVYGERQRALIDALEKWTTGYLSIFPSHAGLHMSARLADGVDADELIRRAAEAGVGIYSTSTFYRRRREVALIFGYGACPVEDIQEGIRRLGALLRSMGPG